MKLADMLKAADEGRTGPTAHQLNRIGVLALLAWGEDQVRYGFEFTKTGVRIFVKQTRRNGNIVQQDGDDSDAIVEAIEEYLTGIAVRRTGNNPEDIQAQVQLATGDP